MLKEKLLIHIPHTSLDVPDFFIEKLLISKKEFAKENFSSADMYLDLLVSDLKMKTIIFPYSRLFCDVERFVDDNKEEMARLGMGVVYTNTVDGKKLIESSSEYKNFIIENFYIKHHNEFQNEVEKIISKYKECYIIDLHSFSDALVVKLLNSKDNPDVCIGVDEDFKDEKFIKLTVTFFEKAGLKVKINYPYRGSIVPNKFYYAKDTRVKSIMIEINKRLYLDANGLKNENFNKLKTVISEYFEELSNY